MDLSHGSSEGPKSASGDARRQPQDDKREIDLAEANVKSNTRDIWAASEETLSLNLPKRFLDNLNTREVLSRKLRDDIRGTVDPFQQRPLEVSDQRFDELRRLTHKHLNKPHQSYHGLVYVEQMLAVKDFLLHKGVITEQEGQLLKLAALFRNVKFSGRALFSYDRDSLYSSGEARSNLADQQVSAVMADEFLADDLSIPQRLELQGLILSSTPPIPNTALFHEHPYAPRTRLEKIFEFMERGSFVLDAERFLSGQLSAYEEEILHSSHLEDTRNFSSWIERQSQHCQEIHSSLKLSWTGLFSVPIHLELLDKLHDIRTQIDLMRQGQGGAKKKWERKFEHADAKIDYRRRVATW